MSGYSSHGQREPVGDDALDALLDGDFWQVAKGNPPGAGSDARLWADLHFLHALLEHLHDPRPGVTESRVQSVMDAIDIPEPASAMRSGAMPAGSLVQRLVISGLTVAAAVLLMVVGWGLLATLKHNTAYAAIAAAARQAAVGVDRHYSLHTLLQLVPGRPSEVESQMYVRGSEKFAITHPVPFGRIWIGSNGQNGWMVGPNGSTSTSDDPRFILKLLDFKRIGLPDFTMSALAAELTHEHDLVLLPAAELDEMPGVTWKRVEATRRKVDGEHPRRVELWIQPETGVVRRMVLDFKRAANHLGLARVSLDLVEEHPRPDSWYEPTSHQP